MPSQVKNNKKNSQPSAASKKKKQEEREPESSAAPNPQRSSSSECSSSSSPSSAQHKGHANQANSSSSSSTGGVTSPASPPLHHSSATTTTNSNKNPNNLAENLRNKKPDVKSTSSLPAFAEHLKVVLFVIVLTIYHFAHNVFVIVRHHIVAYVERKCPLFLLRILGRGGGGGDNQERNDPLMTATHEGLGGGGSKGRSSASKAKKKSPSPHRHHHHHHHANSRGTEADDDPEAHPTEQQVGRLASKLIPVMAQEIGIEDFTNNGGAEGSSAAKNGSGTFGSRQHSSANLLLGAVTGGGAGGGLTPRHHTHHSRSHSRHQSSADLLLNDDAADGINERVASLFMIPSTPHHNGSSSVANNSVQRRQSSAAMLLREDSATGAGVSPSGPKRNPPPSIIIPTGSGATLNKHDRFLSPSASGTEFNGSTATSTAATHSPHADAADAFLLDAMQKEEPLTQVNPWIMIASADTSDIKRGKEVHRSPSAATAQKAVAAAETSVSGAGGIPKISVTSTAATAAAETRVVNITATPPPPSTTAVPVRDEEEEEERGAPAASASSSSQTKRVAFDADALSAVADNATTAVSRDLVVAVEKKQEEDDTDGSNDDTFSSLQFFGFHRHPDPKQAALHYSSEQYPYPLYSGHYHTIVINLRKEHSYTNVGYEREVITCSFDDNPVFLEWRYAEEQEQGKKWSNQGAAIYKKKSFMDQISESFSYITAAAVGNGGAGNKKVHENANYKVNHTVNTTSMSKIGAWLAEQQQQLKKRQQQLALKQQQPKQSSNGQGGGSEEEEDDDGDDDDSPSESAPFIGITGSPLHAHPQTAAAAAKPPTLNINDRPKAVIVIMPGVNSTATTDYIQRFVLHATQSGYHTCFVSHRGLADAPLDSENASGITFTKDLEEVLEKHLSDAYLLEKFGDYSEYYEALEGRTAAKEATRRRHKLAKEERRRQRQSRNHGAERQTANGDATPSPASPPFSPHSPASPHGHVGSPSHDDDAPPSLSYESLDGLDLYGTIHLQDYHRDDANDDGEADDGTNKKKRKNKRKSLCTKANGDAEEGGEEDVGNASIATAASSASVQVRSTGDNMLTAATVSLGKNPADVVGALDDHLEQQQNDDEEDASDDDLNDEAIAAAPKKKLINDNKKNKNKKTIKTLRPIKVIAIGFSMGAACLCNYLYGRSVVREAYTPHSAPLRRLHCAVAVSAPWELTAFHTAISTPFALTLYNKIITGHLLNAFKQSAEIVRRHAKRPEVIAAIDRLNAKLKANEKDPSVMQNYRFTDYERDIILPQLGYPDCETYYKNASPFPNMLRRVAVPMLCFTANDDPITGIPPNLHRWESVCKENPNLCYVRCPTGGHLGFLRGPVDEMLGKASFMDERVIRALDTAIAHGKPQHSPFSFAAAAAANSK